MPEKVY